MKHQTRGFTVVELIIVIIIIGLLVIVSLVSYNGVQTRAKNSQTLEAANQWLKVIKIYQARSGSLPAAPSCLGDGYRYGQANTATTGVAQCRQSPEGNITTNSATVDAFRTYSSISPTPAMTTATNSPSDWYRGIFYDVNANVASLTFVLHGDNTSACPKTFSNITLSTEKKTADKHNVCTYAIGNVTTF